MGWISVLKKIGQGTTELAPPLIRIAAPPGTPTEVATAIANAVSQNAARTVAIIEVARGAGGGDAKLKAAIELLMQAVFPITVQAIETSLGKDCVDEVLLCRAMQKYVEASVDLLNAIKVPAAEEVTGKKEINAVPIT